MINKKDFSTKLSYRYQKVGRKIQFVNEKGRQVYAIRLIWLGLLEYVDDAGRCNPGYEALMTYAGVGSRHTIKNAIDIFVKMGLLVYAAGGNGLKDSNSYQFDLEAMTQTVISQGRYPDPESMKLARPTQSAHNQNSVQSTNSVHSGAFKSAVCDEIECSLSEKVLAECTGTILNHIEEPQNEPQGSSDFFVGLGGKACLAVERNRPPTDPTDQQDNNYTSAPVSKFSIEELVEASLYGIRAWKGDKAAKAEEIYDNLTLKGATPDQLAPLLPFFVDMESSYSDELAAQTPQTSFKSQNASISHGNGPSDAFTAKIDHRIQTAALKAESLINEQHLETSLFVDFYRQAIVYRPLQRAEYSLIERIKAIQTNKIVRKAGVSPKSPANRIVRPEDLDDLLREFRYEWEVLGKPEIEPYTTAVA